MSHGHSDGAAFEAKVGVIVVTYRGRRHLERCLPPLRDSPLRPRILVVDSSSDDGTAEEAEALGADVLVVPQRDFNHGATRELARKRLGAEVVVMVSQDAYARDEQTLGHLVEPVLAGEAAVAYGRQVARPGAGPFEDFLRRFSYPPESNLRGIADVARYGAALSFCSNAFAAWRQSTLDDVGGFPTTLSHEDAIAAALLLKRGHRIAYVADAVVEHSHRYTVSGDFRRYFDAGYARTQHRAALEISGTHVAHGRRYALELFRHLAGTRPWMLPYAAAHVLAKALGFTAGAMAVGGPTWFARSMSGQGYYWSSVHYRVGAADAARAGRDLRE